MVAKLRVKRVAGRIQEVISELLLNEVTDPGLSGVSVTHVKVDRELEYATIYVSAVEGSERKEEILAGFDRARGFLRYNLSQRIDVRSFPKLRFKWDPTPERAERIEKLIDSLSDSTGEGEPAGPADG